MYINTFVKLNNNNDIFKIQWDKYLITDKEVQHNGHNDRTLYNKSVKGVYLIDVSRPNTNNLTHKYREKLKITLNKVAHIWNVNKVKIKPVIISSTSIRTYPF